MLEVYDKTGKLIGYVRRIDIHKHPLTETRQVGERKRELWLKELTTRSRNEKWSSLKAREIVHQEVKASPHLTTENSRSAAKSEGILAADPSVRDEFERLLALRDECWKREQAYLRLVKHGPHQLLVDILRRHSRSLERLHTRDADTYLAFMHREYAA